MPKELGAIALPGEKRRWSDYVLPYKFKDNAKADKVRPFGLVWEDFRHAVQTKSGKIYYEFCHAWDVENERFFDDRESRCPCCKLNIPGSRRYFMNVIVLDLVDQRPANPPADWTPVRMIEMAQSLYAKVVDCAEMNRGVHVTDPEKGAVIIVKFDDSKEPANKYTTGVDEKAYSLSANDLTDFIAVQKYPGGKTVIKKGDGRVPGSFEYIRVVNTRDDMIQSLKRQGYYEQVEAAPAEPQAPRTRTAPEDLDLENVPVQEANEHVKRAAHTLRSAPIPEDEAPPPRGKVVKKPAQEELDEIPFDLRVSSKEGNPSTPAKNLSVAKGQFIKTETPDAEALRAQKPAGCPSDFGKFVSAQECYLSCSVMDFCRSMSPKDNDFLGSRST